MNKEKVRKIEFDYSRYQTWVSVSFRWVREDKDRIIPSRIQGLGIIDAKLYSLKRDDIVDENGMPYVDEFDIPIFDHANTNSYLWVIGTYELLRMIDDRLRYKPQLAREDSILAINEAKKQFARIRMPLAKSEAADKYESVDYDVAMFGGNHEKLGWQINDNDIVYYRDLSDLTINTLRKLWPRPGQ